ncbi:MAG: bifunctional oligoribonuclease/PAP phosphatase NrnA [Candidatus Gastranaerophilales bacterium]|nr:bifunctional oligoribonuclease/PAP phosphatase NrnA [Candidatus Gastranaerophilales bacterium]
MNTYIEVLEKIKSAQNILLVSHIGPDGDTVASTLAMNKLIKKNFPDKNPVFVIQHKIPDVYTFLPGIEDCILTNHEVKVHKFDLAIALDCATLDRMGYFEKIYKKANFTINLDHHITNPHFADINIVEGHFSSTAEVIYKLFVENNLEIDKETALCLYTGLLTDTGGFRYSNTNEASFEAAKQLVSLGANPTEIFEKCYERKPKEMLKIAAFAVYSAVYVMDDKISYTKIDRKMLEEFNAKDEHLEGISEILRQEKDVEVSFVVKETVKKEAKFSFRSKRVDVSQICEFFGGGGHKLAAGCIIQKSLDEAINDVLPIVKSQVKKCL